MGCDEPTSRYASHCEPLPNWQKIKVYYKFNVRKIISAQCILAALIEYKNISKKTLQESIKSEMSGNLEKLLVAVGEQNITSLPCCYRCLPCLSI